MQPGFLPMCQWFIAGTVFGLIGLPAAVALLVIAAYRRHWGGGRSMAE